MTPTLYIVTRTFTFTRTILKNRWAVIAETPERAIEKAKTYERIIGHFEGDTWSAVAHQEGVTAL